MSSPLFSSPLKSVAKGKDQWLETGKGLWVKPLLSLKRWPPKSCTLEHGVSPSSPIKTTLVETQTHTHAPILTHGGVLCLPVHTHGGVLYLTVHTHGGVLYLTVHTHGGVLTVCFGASGLERVATMKSGGELGHSFPLM